MTKSAIYILLFHCFVISICSKPAFVGIPDRITKKALRIIRNNAPLTDTVAQVLVVFSETQGSSFASLVALEKKGNTWKVAAPPVKAGIGRNGFAAPGNKREGDNQSPTGFFRLGQLFCYEKEVNTRMPFIQTTADDKWIDDPNSSDYNRYIRGRTQAVSYENLKISSDEYKYCMVIEYNMHPVVKGMGSAIFLHLSMGDVPNSSSGCVVVTPEHMEWLLKWMNPGLKPSILMGSEKILISGKK